MKGLLYFLPELNGTCGQDSPRFPLTDLPVFKKSKFQVFKKTANLQGWTQSGENDKNVMPLQVSLRCV